MAARLKPVYNNSIQGNISRSRIVITRANNTKTNSRDSSVLAFPDRKAEEEDEEIVFKVCELLSQHRLDFNKNHEILPRLKPHHIDQILVKTQTSIDPRMALQFFRWAGQQEGFYYNIKSCCVLIHFLVRENILGPASSILHQLIEGSIPTLTLPKGVMKTHGNGRRHAEIVDSLIGTYETCSSSVKVFDLLIHIYLQTRMIQHGVDVFFLIRRHGLTPSLRSCNNLLSGLLKSKTISLVWRIYEEMLLGGIKPDVYTFSTMINACCKEGKIEEAMDIFVKMEKSGCSPTVVTYNILIDGLCKKNCLDQAFDYKEKMCSRGFTPNVVTYSVLINGLCKARELEKASSLVQEMSGNGLMPNTVTYNTLIDGYCNEGNIAEALRLRDEMVLKGIEPNSVTYSVLMQGLCKAGEVMQAYCLLEEMLSRDLVIDARLFNLVINTLCKVGQVQKAVRLFKEMVCKDLTPNDSIYTVLVGRLCKSGNAEEALGLHDIMLRKGFFSKHCNF